MHRFVTGQNLLLTGVLLLCLLPIFGFDKALAQKLDFNALEISQELNPDNQTVSIVAIVDPAIILRGDQLTLRIIGRIDQGHHLYSVRKQGEFAPDPTDIIVNAAFLKATSELDESTTLLINDDAFNTTLQVHKNDFWITRQYHLNEKAVPGVHQLSGYLIYQVCNNRICSLPLKNHFYEKITILDKQ